MNCISFKQNIKDQIKEAQLKLGYAEETVRLYFPTASLNAILETDEPDSQAMFSMLQTAFRSPDPELGQLHFSRAGGRIEVSIPPDGVRFVHEHVEDPPFLSDLIGLFTSRTNCSLEEIQAVFAKYDSRFICRKMPEDADFDWCLHFPPGSTDSYYYCIKEEMGHTIYHRFIKADFDALMKQQ